MRSLIVAAAAACFVAAGAASASVLAPGDYNFVSNPGDTVNGTDSAVGIKAHRRWADDGYLLDGSRWISVEANDGSRGPAGGHVDVFEETFTGNAGGWLDWAVLADDTAKVELFGPNGFFELLYDFNTGPNQTCAKGAIGCEPGEEGTGRVALAFAGDHVFRVSVMQDGRHGGSPFGTQYAGVVTTPLPAAGALFAAGVVGLMGWRRRQQR